MSIGLWQEVQEVKIELGELKAELERVKQERDAKRVRLQATAEELAIDLGEAQGQLKRRLEQIESLQLALERKDRALKVAKSTLLTVKCRTTEKSRAGIAVREALAEIEKEQK